MGAHVLLESRAAVVTRVPDRHGHLEADGPLVKEWLHPAHRGMVYTAHFFVKSGRADWLITCLPHGQLLFEYDRTQLCPWTGGNASAGDAARSVVRCASPPREAASQVTRLLVVPGEGAG